MQLALLLNPIATSFAHIGLPPAHVPLPTGLSVFFVSDETRAGDTLQAYTSYGASSLLFTVHVLRIVPALDDFKFVAPTPAEQARLLHRNTSPSWFVSGFASPLDGLTPEQQRAAIDSCFHKATLALFRKCASLDNEAHVQLTDQFARANGNAHAATENPGEFLPCYLYLKDVF